LSSASDILLKYWKFSTFRPLQEEIIESVIAGKDVLAVLPTGGGKSVCFQVPAMLRDGVCIVVTPLIALMKDQVQNLRRKGISAHAIFSGMSKKEIDTTLDNCIYGNIKFLYISPERLNSRLFQERFQQMNVSLIAIDEAHCISQWGHDFRPAYLELGSIREFAPGINVIALTATAVEVVQNEIIEKLNLNSPALFSGSFLRPNLSYSVRKVEDKEKKMIEILKSIPGTAIIYTRTRKDTKEINQLLLDNNISAINYHAGLSPKDRSIRQDKWMTGKIRVMVATNAFGMGIDKPDVRMVIHDGLVSNMESYYQEAGRAGRDSLKAFAVILFQEKDVSDLKESFKRSYPEFSFIQHVYQCLANYYKLAVGSEHGAGFDFILHDFSSQYGMDHLEVYYALKKLEDENLIQINEIFSSQSAVHMTIEHNDLYKFQIANAQFDPLIKALLRSHGGELFSQFTPISEYKLARITKHSESRIREELTRLQKQGVIIYIPPKEKPQIVFLTPRLDAKKLPFDKKSLLMRKSNDKARLDFMISYLKEIRICRTNMIQEYFGEEVSKVCGICDVCVSNKAKYNDPDKDMITRQKIINLVKDSPLSIDELVEKIRDLPSGEVLSIIRQIVDMGDAAFDDAGKLSISIKN